VKITKWFDPEEWKNWLQAPVSRRGFLRGLAVAAGSLLVSGKAGTRAWAKAGVTLAPRKRRTVAADCPLAVVESDNPAAAARKAVEALGGISRFVKSGDVVVVKPNIGWDRRPEQAGNTNPEVVAALVALCREAGAKTVKVFDYTCNDARRTYVTSGIQDAVRKAGGQVSFVSDWKFYSGRFPAGSAMADWPIYRDAVECDCFINVPVAKHHGLTGLTLSIKNLMGVCGGGRGKMHWGIDQKLVEVAAFIQPDLTVIDAYRILLRHGPTGGNLEDVALKKIVLASTDPVLADAYAATLFGRKPEDIGYIKLAAEKGLGSMNLKQSGIKHYKI